MSDTKRRALLSVSDKTGIVDLGRSLVSRGWEILSTGGTARALEQGGVPVTSVSQVTGHPEIMEGRVKTLHPAIHGPLLARRDREDDLAALSERGYGPIDLVAVNLYPFRETVARPAVTLTEAMENVDIGGPTMIRAAAKNHRFVWVVVDPDDYGSVIEAIDGGAEEEQLRRALAAKVFEHVATYDAAVAKYLGNGGHPGAQIADLGAGVPDAESAEPTLPRALELSTAPGTRLRYGENPDQIASFYPAGEGAGGLAELEQLHGKALSYNNYLDLDGALLSVAALAFLETPSVCIVKHTTPCGMATAPSVVAAYERALATDPTSAFGSVIALTRRVDVDAAEALSQLFVECVVAPGYEEAALERLTRKKNVRLLVMPELPERSPLPIGGEAAIRRLPEDGRRAARFLSALGAGASTLSHRSVYGGVLLQSASMPPFVGVPGAEWSVVTDRAPTPEEEADLRFAWAAVYGVKSNAILLAKGGRTLGIGAGQMSRVDASELAVFKAGQAGLDLTGAALASDAFFPFRDGVDAAAKAGARSIVQPGGSIRDDEVIAAANENGIAMVFTGRRLFRH